MCPPARLIFREFDGKTLLTDRAVDRMLRFEPEAPLLNMGILQGFFERVDSGDSGVIVR